LNPVEFVIDYCKRHAHPVNAILHLIGVPAAFYGVYELFCGAYFFGFELIVIGYILQYFGHKAQGNEVGEVTLIKSIIRALSKKTGNGHG
jgi:Protein of unknown function (DUF962)